MFKNLGEIAEYVKGELNGDPSVKITGIAGIEDAQTGDLTFLANDRYARFLKSSSASAVIVGMETDIEGIGMAVIKHPHPYFAFAKSLEFFSPEKRAYPEGIHPTAVLEEGIKIEKGVHIGAYVVLEKGVWLKPGVKVLSGSFIGTNSFIGENSLIHPNVTIGENTEIGNNVIIHSGTVIGSDGFGYVKEQGIHHKIPQLGRVRIEKDVEIGEAHSRCHGKCHEE